ncbi:hypothetical protein Lepto7376_2456 [[Leptolyngbya] sp. PCC 7376]|uniref:hypothetical protein n=1 Tax=[Leptolyngbya] sp. PCC 7376 TaxID=111781 RepID=UPI00029EF979|nr:hypothetical protein [[Leptolyngbya] sp. PCC 7376]AFY38735.1 hypothetical protein Lepto7376_2456 [[Leptolyngbya] sp. PCC 7376]
MRKVDSLVRFEYTGVLGAIALIDQYSKLNFRNLTVSREMLRCFDITGKIVNKKIYECLAL